MKKIYSKVKPDKLLHFIRRKEEAITQREDLVEPNNFIQCSQLKLNAGQTFKPHKHIWKSRTMDVIAQESWIVIQGSVECHFYDIDDSLLEKATLNIGDASFTLEGGHNYLILEDNTIVYEYKTGPYEGIELDKTFL